MTAHTAYGSHLVVPEPEPEPPKPVYPDAQCRICERWAGTYPNESLINDGIPSIHPSCQAFVAATTR